ncbi:hypothetical protein HYV86_04700 [Candidatus Woesearchaeota archaeon]|nr:hypothetical protein [Candidatus Woesearchaeota archaeon]
MTQELQTKSYLESQGWTPHILAIGEELTDLVWVVEDRISPQEWTHYPRVPHYASITRAIGRVCDPQTAARGLFHLDLKGPVSYHCIDPPQLPFTIERTPPKVSFNTKRWYLEGSLYVRN